MRETTFSSRWDLMGRLALIQRWYCCCWYLGCHSWKLQCFHFSSQCFPVIGFNTRMCRKKWQEMARAQVIAISFSCPTQGSGIALVHDAQQHRSAVGRCWTWCGIHLLVDGRSVQDSQGAESTRFERTAMLDSGLCRWMSCWAWELGICFGWLYVKCQTFAAWALLSTVGHMCIASELASGLR